MMKRNVSLIASVVILLLLALVSTNVPHTARGAQGTTTATMSATMASTASGLPLLFDGKEAFKHAEAQVNFGIRPTGSDALFKTGDYFIAKLKEYGWTVTEQPFTLDIDGRPIKGRNIIGSMGKGPVVIIGAHYDTRLWADNDPDPAKRREPVMGANDAASGAAVLLELARVMGKHYTYNREVRLLFLDAEDNGNIPGWKDFSLGTYYYVDHLDVKPEYVIILDMIGDADLNIYYETFSMQSAPDVMIGLWDVAEKLGYGSTFIKQPKYSMTDDHTPFIMKGIPAIDVIDFDYPYWHTVSDTLDKISAASLEKVGRVVQAYLAQTGVIRASS